MTYSRPPASALRPFIDLIWASDGGSPSDILTYSREIVLPTGATHMVFRLGDTPLQLYSSAEDKEGEDVGNSLIGGPRAGSYIKGTSSPEPTVGIMLRPGATELMLGASAPDLAGRHTRLEDIWPRALLDEIRIRLQETDNLSSRLLIIEGFLLARLPRMRGIHPLIMHSIEQFRFSVPVGEVVEESGFSHRYFTQLFTEHVGLRPKTYCRVLRLGRVLDRIKTEPAIGSAELAIAEGYADQAHMNREFQALTSLTPGAYRNAAPPAPRHIPLP